MKAVMRRHYRHHAASKAGFLAQLRAWELMVFSALGTGAYTWFWHGCPRSNGPGWQPLRPGFLLED